jgi:hypothetical protein
MRLDQSLRSILAVFALAPFIAETDAASMRFFGTSNYASAADARDRVRVLIDASPARTANVGATDTTIEFWLKAQSANNNSAAATCPTAEFRNITFGPPDRWIPGHIVIDQDIAGSNGATHADWGISVAPGYVAYGLRGRTVEGITICANVPVLDDAWHHLAFQRRVSDGRLWIFVDGVLRATAVGAPGDASYSPGFATSRPNSDPYTVFGAEKLGDFDWPNFNGLLTEIRLSTVLRYGSGTTLNQTVFLRPNARFSPDAQTASLWHFTEGSGSVVADAAGNSPAEVRFNSAGTQPAWATESPFGSALACALDVDASGSTNAATDGVLIIRYLFGFRNSALTDGTLGANATRDASEIAGYLATLDLNADGSPNNGLSAATDGLLVYRALSGQNGAALIAGARATDTTRDAQQILDWLTTTHGAGCLP